ncbi:MAG: type III pantothenate kinase [bacterium]|nr:type III pantothenate kinase [bacterium]
MSTQILCLDQGNTRLKGVLYDGGESVRAFHVTDDEPGALNRELAGLDPKMIRVALCCVTPSREVHIKGVLRELGLPVWQVQSTHSVPFAVKVEQRGTLGADRLCNVAAAWREQVMPAIIIDAGTAMTLDIVNAAGEFEGGLICPGRGILARALAHGGERLFEVGSQWPQEIVGVNTADALAAGVSWGLQSAAEGLVTRLNEERGVEHEVILTGGDAPSLAERWRGGKPRLEPDWTMRGILTLATDIGEWRR